MSQELPVASDPTLGQERPGFRIGTPDDGVLFVQAWSDGEDVTIDVAPPAMGDGSMEVLRDSDLEPGQIVSHLHEKYTGAESLEDIDFDPLREQVSEVFR